MIGMPEEESVGPLFSVPEEGLEPKPRLSLPWVEPASAEDSPMDSAELERYLRLTGATVKPRTAQAQKAAGDGPAWVESLSNGRFLVCDRALSWHPAKTLAEAKRLVEHLRFQAANPSTLTAAWMEEQADLLRPKPTPGARALRAVLEGLDLAYREQAVLGWRLADFLVEERLVIEVDGDLRRSRKAPMDERCRDEELVRRGFLVLRFGEQEVLGGPGAVGHRIGTVMDDVALAGMAKPQVEPSAPEAQCIFIFTDGGCAPNPGAGGYGVVLTCEGRRREISGGFVRTTNNRMEIYAAIAGLEALQKPGSRVVLCSDSRYLIDAIDKGWARKWQRNNWMRTPEDKAKNADLWARLLRVLGRHQVTFQWVRGHSGHPEN